MPSPPRHIFLVGHPRNLGGAGIHCWHTVKLWRRCGLNVTLLPTWKAPPAWRKRLDGIGCRTIETSPDRLRQVPGLSDGLVVSFCNAEFLRVVPHLRRLGCRLVWLNCMTWLSPRERSLLRRHGPMDVYVFQSRYQQGQLQPRLEKLGVSPTQCHHIRGAFCWDEFPFRPKPRKPGEPLVVGRLSRPDPDKYARDTWAVYRRIPHPIRARLMGWDRRIEQKLGPPPDWAECLPPGRETSAAFLGSLDCMLQINGGARENWPRSGLEAMALGVPVVAENRWGWREMIRHGETGYLADTSAELAHHAGRLAHDEAHRLELAHRARTILETELAEPETLWRQWRRVFG